MRNSEGRNSEEANDLLEYSSSNGLHIAILDIDVTSDESVESVIDSLPAIDVLINNAGAGFGEQVQALYADETPQRILC